MTDPLAQNGFTVKDLIVGIVLPKLDSIDAKLDQKAEVDRVAAIEAELDKKVETGRVDILERELQILISWRNRALGGFAVIATLLSVATATLVAILSGHHHL